ncbi:TorF family putative porin [Ottowia thiooxydans]|uniref:TorF family putative porin n=1 Tax=Ottowia thiooxydans TaxID=219182 RepID=UPI0003F849CC|nr:TorF family putative porin [Ottowia thiooxydans]
MAISPFDSDKDMRLKLFKSLAGTAALCGGAAVAAWPTAAAAQLTGSLALTSDYVWRGSSQTREKPAIQGAVKYAHDSGLYASVWGSNVKFKPDNGATAELDIALGWNGKVAPDWALDVYFLRYQYPGAHTSLNWNEINAAVTWRDNYWISVGRSTNAMASKSTGTYALIGTRYPINDDWRVEGTLARYFLDHAYAKSYTHGSLGVIWAFKAPFEARLTVHSTDSATKQLFPGMGGSRVEFALQASF